MSFHDTELDVIRYAEACGILNKRPEDQALLVVSSVGSLCNSIVNGGKVHVTEDMGRVAMDMIALCAILDIDLAKSLETAFNKISAKPVDNQTKAEAAMWAAKNQADAASNVVFLKQE